jgi:hypothetical protein
MIRTFLRTAVLTALLAGPFLCQTAPAQTRHSIDFTPMSPLMKIYAVHYCYRITPRSEIIAGPLYMRIHYDDIGHTDAPGFIVGYRRYVWRSFHVAYQLMPGWDHFYEENEKKRYDGFDLWNEFQFGYTWDFNVKRTPAFIHFQWPLGFALYSDPDGKPESFKKHARENPVFYFPPMFFMGIRF